LWRHELRAEQCWRRSRRGLWVAGSIPIINSLFLMWVFQ
jgi:hypothetical protein